MDEDVNRAAVNGSNTDVPSNSKVTHHQLSKFQELQRRRLQLISKPKNKKFKAKATAGAKPKLQKEELGTKGFLDDNSDQRMKDSNVTNSNSHGTESNEVLSSSPRVNIHPAFQKKKLHWGAPVSLPVAKYMELDVRLQGKVGKKSKHVESKSRVNFQP